MLLEENKVLAPFTTLGIGGRARWFVDASSEADIVESTGWARESRVPVFILGGGSNLLVSDSGFEGLILHIALKGIQVSLPDSDPSQCIYQAAAGEDWDAFVQLTVENECAGIECLAGIPGTVGGTPVQNVGAYGQEVATTIQHVRVFDLQQRTFAEFAPAECGFGYRSSRFNSIDKGRFVVTRVDYHLEKNGSPTLKYADLRRAISPGTSPTLKEVAQTVRCIRETKGMLLADGDPDCRSAGSFFKNPIVDTERAVAIAVTAGSEPPRFIAGASHPGMIKIPAAWLIERAGFGKGFALGRAGISNKHTLALINRGNATALEILALAHQIRSAVGAKFGVELQMEPVMLGF